MIVIGISLVFLVQKLFSESSKRLVGCLGHGESSIFMSYAGSIFSLSLGEDDNKITANRNIGYDCSLKAMYPFAGSVNKLQDQIPVITANGKVVPIF